MLGLGTRLFISSEQSYGTVYNNDLDFGSGNYTTISNEEYHTYYIDNDRITTSFNQSEVDYVSSNRGRRNVFHKNVNNLEGNFSFNLQYNMLKFFSFITNNPDRQNLIYSGGDNTLTFSNYQIITIPNGSNTDSFNDPTVNYPVGGGNPIIVKTIQPTNNNLLSLQLRHKGITDYSYFFHGCCINSISIKASTDETVSLEVTFLGQREEEKDDWTPTTKIQDVYADIYPSWKAELELDFGSGYVTIPFKDFILNIENNLEFAPFIENTNNYPSKPPFPGLRATTGSFSIEYEDLNNYYDYIIECKDDIKLKLTLEDDNSKFIINCPNIVFTDGGSLASLPEGMLELDLNFTAIDKSILPFGNGIPLRDETGNYSESTTTLNFPYTEEVKFTIREE